MKKVIEFIVRGGEVERFHTRRTIQQETVGHHSFLVATIVLLLSVNPSKNIILAALCHDLGEQVVGDIPGDVKKEIPSFGEIRKMEESLLKEHGLLFNVFENEKRTLKLADNLAGYIFCKREYELGSVGIETIRNTYKSNILSMGPFSLLEQSVISAVVS